ncbi:hypothetical protein LCGC14_1085550 [marine sediment metagenome]|uniref:N-acetyltransferase domain-containing protein n=1 Tax=marine sediment metagenome TaxID=412755 RepID=A0A0F9MID9_9ZZZZ
MARRKRNKKLEGARRVFVKMYDGHAEVSVAMDELHNIFGGILRYTDYNPNMVRWKILAAGRVFWSSEYNSFYGTDTKVQHAYRGQGHGDLLYKAMILVADKLAKKAGLNTTYFSPHAACGCSTSDSAWRCYKALVRKGYLKTKDKDRSHRDRRYEVVKLPKRIKPIFLRAA